MKKGFTAIALVLVVVVVAAVGTAGYLLFRGKGGGGVIPVGPSSPDQSGVNSGSVYSAHNVFGFKVLKLISNEEKGNNIFISPTSIAFALSMVYNGAQSETKAAMEKTLEFNGIGIDNLNSASKDLMGFFDNVDPKVKVAIANSIWGRKGISFKDSFLGLMKGTYQAKVSSLDFADVNSAKTINAWVSDNTNGKIKEIVQSPIPPEIVMYLINAVYFKGDWNVAFDQKLTQPRDFSLPSQSKVRAPMMEQDGKFDYLENVDFQAVRLPYGENKRLAMYVFLPKDLNKFTESLSSENWKKWTEGFKETKGTVILPKFKIEYEKKLKGVLTSLGMGVAFQDNADFGGMRDEKDLKISEVLHKTFVEVDEKGTEAAAVTSVVMKEIDTAIPDKTETFYMEVNHPFFFAIHDSKSGELLFAGLINNPI